MRKIIKRVASFFLMPLSRWYLRKPRTFTYAGTRIKVMPGVFHPGLFYSTKFLLGYLLNNNLAQSTLLELGCGTGLISVLAAKNGAFVTAIDLSHKAIENVTLNALENDVTISVIHSDLFKELPPQQFDWIIINPPYYNNQPKDEADLAWNAGADFAYFHKMFASLRFFMHQDTKVIMVLTLGTALEKIMEIGSSNGYQFETVAEMKVLFDKKDFLFRIMTSGNS